MGAPILKTTIELKKKIYDLLKFKEFRTTRYIARELKEQNTTRIAQYFRRLESDGLVDVVSVADISQVPVAGFMRTRTFQMVAARKKRSHDHGSQ
jgi:metal-dependent amidase/aminoacylase/carboxypeptidase family protein